MYLIVNLRKSSLLHFFNLPLLKREKIGFGRLLIVLIFIKVRELQSVIVSNNDIM